MIQWNPEFPYNVNLPRPGASFDHVRGPATPCFDLLTLSSLPLVAPRGFAAGYSP